MCGSPGQQHRINSFVLRGRNYPNSGSRTLGCSIGSASSVCKHATSTFRPASKAAVVVMLGMFVAMLSFVVGGDVRSTCIRQAVNNVVRACSGSVCLSVCLSLSLSLCVSLSLSLTHTHVLTSLSLSLSLSPVLISGSLSLLTSLCLFLTLSLSLSVSLCLCAHV